MSILKSLDVVAVERPAGYDPVRSRRRKLAAAIDVQLGLLAAEQSGLPFRKTVFKRYRDLETDILTERQEQRRVAPWWWLGDDGRVNLQLRYGAAVLRLAAGKSVFIATDLNGAGVLLGELRKAALTGELDDALDVAAVGLKARFRPTRKTKN